MTTHSMMFSHEVKYLGGYLQFLTNSLKNIYESFKTSYKYLLTLCELLLNLLLTP